MPTTSAYMVNGSPSMCLVTASGVIWSLLNTPEGSEVSGLSNKWATIERQGLKPLIRFDSAQLRVMTFSHTLTYRRGRLDHSLEVFAALGESTGRVRIAGGAAGIETKGWWYVTDLSIKIREREVNQDARVADLDWVFTEAVDERPSIAHTPPPPRPKRSPPMQTSYTVKSGDSLWSIAARLLGKGTRWTEIYDLNKDRLHLKPPELYKGLITVWIYPGQVMLIPKR